jgi:hypothetical protein
MMTEGGRMAATTLEFGVQAWRVRVPDPQVPEVPPIDPEPDPPHPDPSPGAPEEDLPEGGPR